jgi:transcriptional antiterminator NusG
MHNTLEGTKSALPALAEGEAVRFTPTIDWYCIWTRSHCEELVAGQLDALNIEVFLPKVMQWRRRDGRRTLSEQILFPGYLFVRHAMDKTTHVRILKTRGVVRLLGERWDRLSAVPAEEVTAIHRMVTAGTRPRRYPHFQSGRPVRILAGPLAGLRGTFVTERPNRSLFLVSLSLLQRTVSVEIDAHCVEPL